MPSPRHVTDSSWMRESCVLLLCHFGISDFHHSPILRRLLHHGHSTKLWGVMDYNSNSNSIHIAAFILSSSPNFPSSVLSFSLSLSGNNRHSDCAIQHYGKSKGAY